MSTYCQADDNVEKKEELKSYYNKCTANLNSPEVLKMADTLHLLARKTGNTYYQVLSKTLILDYYYFKNDKDSVMLWVDKIKKISREKKEFETYYFAWGSRLIMFYLKSGMSNHALKEAKNMLREATIDKFEPGIAECYKAMANIHLLQSNPEQAVLNFMKLIEIVEKRDAEDVNLPVYYTSMIENMLQMDKMADAEVALSRAQAMMANVKSATAYQTLCLTQSYLRFYIKKGDFPRAKKELSKIENLFAESPGLAVFSVYLYDAQLRYYMAVKDYSKALAVINIIENDNPSAERKLMILSNRGEIYWKMDNKAAAADCYKNYIVSTDSIRKVSMRNSAEEISGMLNLHQLEQEKQQLMIDMQDRELSTIYWIVGALAVILLLMFVFFVRIYRLNRALQESKQIVMRQNQVLIETGSELLIAKEQAEVASRMKTHFIQNITHEVRTPLNAIVGFSQVLVDYNTSPEAEEYASLVMINSDHLLRLFNDVLELSNIDQADNLPYDIVEDINASCRVAIESVMPKLKKGVNLIFEPTHEIIKISTNPVYVTQILKNILHNATKFTTKGSITLEYSISLEEGVIRYYVTDTGIGIEVDKHDEVFARFNKLDYFVQGSGLGLSVSRVIAKKLGGALLIDAEYTEGCRLELILPYIPASE